MNNRLVWFRNDLRLHDNETLAAAVGGAPDRVAYVYIYDLESGAAEMPPVGPHRKKFLAESVRALRDRLRERGADLICLAGRSVELLTRVCDQLAITDVYHARLTAFNERRDERELARALAAKSIRVHTFQTHTLLLDEDAGFDVYKAMGFSKRRGLIEKGARFRDPRPEPELVPGVHVVDAPAWDFAPALGAKADARGFRPEGGEAAALERLRHYIWEGGHLQNYRQTRNGLIEIDDSAKISPYLSVGCLSPRFVYAETKRYERERVSNESTRWFFYELLWRDHFHFLARDRGARLFTEAKGGRAKGLQGWRERHSGHAFVDAAMNELRLTGWLSNRMRQIAASYFIFDLGGDWREGARWFETCLMDYDPCSNWGNWAYIAGADAAGQAHEFDVDQQAGAYDPDGSYADLWT